MNLSIDNKITALAVKAIMEFKLIENGDKIAVGLSGGKDSSFLLFVLKILNKYSAVNFDLQAVHVDLGFENSKTNKLVDYCKELNVELKIIESRIADFITKKENQNPCSKCAHFRKGAIINYLKKENYNKLAFGHHLDDVLETFLMNIFYSGQLKTLKPKRFLSKNKIEIIRPLIYLREKTIIEEVKNKNIPREKSLCPYDGKTSRSKIRKDFAEYFEDDIFYNNLLSAMRKKDSQKLWPAEKNYQKLKNDMKKFWKKGVKK